ncbi:hypothetical protein [Pseudonocardia nigra]|uniref:hypothetical protein n=1 Tax=Pseudonocardia nigra TaxID=1921578 RepID=UPI001C5F0430|nr:hypothetical protein [Pseudonocardia nigra]
MIALGVGLAAWALLLHGQSGGRTPLLPARFRRPVTVDAHPVKEPHDVGDPARQH